MASHLMEWVLAKRQKIMNVGEDVEIKELCWAVVRNVNLHSYCGKLTVA